MCWGAFNINIRECFTACCVNRRHKYGLVKHYRQRTMVVTMKSSVQYEKQFFKTVCNSYKINRIA